MAKKDEGASEQGGIRPNVARASSRQSHCQCKKENDRERDGRRQPAKIVIGDDLGGLHRPPAPPAPADNVFALSLLRTQKKRATSVDNETKRIMNASVRGMVRSGASPFDNAYEMGHGRKRT